MADEILEPSDAGTTASMLADAAEQRRPVLPRGSGTKTAWRDLPSRAWYLSTRRLCSPIEHYAGDLVATIPAGATLSEANAVLARSGQWLPLDPAHADCATIGGVVATNDSGPRRHKYGAPRDLIIGIEVALTDGRLAKAGGRVVKNVAGYDLSRLMCGSFGSLAVITSATFKLTPVPAASCTVVATVADLAHAAALAQTVSTAPLTPSAIELEAPQPRLLIRFETTQRAAEQMATAAATILSSNGVASHTEVGETEHTLWHDHEAMIWSGPGTVLKVSVLPSDVTGLFEEVARASEDVEWSAIGRVALGIVFLRLNGVVAAQQRFVQAIHSYVEPRHGSVRVIEAPADARPALHQAPVPSPLAAVMRAVKQRFDPASVLPPLPWI